MNLRCGEYAEPYEAYACCYGAEFYGAFGDLQCFGYFGGPVGDGTDVEAGEGSCCDGDAAECCHEEEGGSAYDVAFAYGAAEVSGEDNVLLGKWGICGEVVVIVLVVLLLYCLVYF